MSNLYTMMLQGAAMIFAVVNMCGANFIPPQPPQPPQPPIHQAQVVPQWKKCIPLGSNMVRLEVLPGGGWDNLRNVDMGTVLDHSYKECKMTEDGQYLIPDDVFIIPMKSSHVQTYAELFENWVGYSSITASTINTEAYGTFDFGTISGSFSQDYKFVKSHQVHDKAITTRVQLRYVFYKVKAQPDSKLNPSFRNRLMEIAAHLQSNNDRHAEYLTQLLVRDFGTHVVTGLDAGAVLAREDNVRSEFKKDHKGSDIKLKLVASYSYMKLYGVKQSVSTSMDNDFVQQYLGNRTSSKTYTHGGPPFKANASLHYWEEHLKENLVAVDRAGDPLHYVITSAVLPELPEPTLRKLASVVERGLKQYYDRNRYPGCLEIASKNFNFRANEDDGSCSLQQNNFTFGGVYQTCNIVGSPGEDPCSHVRQKNPKTADFKCPVDYEPILILSGKTSATCRRRCKYWFIFPRCSYVCGYGFYETYWCVATKKVKPYSGFLFGGLYSRTSVNPFTKAKRCPPKFYDLHFGLTMEVCVSDNYELGAANSVPFAGFFSCRTGNPLALTTSYSTLSGLTGNEAVNNMEYFLFNLGPRSWPKHCPQGYSQHLANIEADCEVLYCIKANILNSNELPTVQRPPFIEFPQSNPNMTLPLAILNEDTERVYLQNPEKDKWEMKSKSEAKNLNLKSYLYTGSKFYDEGLTTGAAAGLTFGLTALVGIMLAMLVLGCRWKRKKRLQAKKNREMGDYKPACDDDTYYEEPIYASSVPLLKDTTTRGYSPQTP